METQLVYSNVLITGLMMVFVLKIVKSYKRKEEKKNHSAIQDELKTSKGLSSTKDTKDFLDLSGGILGI